MSVWVDVFWQQLGIAVSPPCLWRLYSCSHTCARSISMARYDTGVLHRTIEPSTTAIHQDVDPRQKNVVLHAAQARH